MAFRYGLLLNNDPGTGLSSYEFNTFPYMAVREMTKPLVVNALEVQMQERDYQGV
jgi:hypothetical protein